MRLLFNGNQITKKLDTQDKIFTLEIACKIEYNEKKWMCYIIILTILLWYYKN